MNPILPNYEYVPDGEPHVFGDRVYLYGSHDRFGGYAFCLNDYVCWSAPVDDLSAWRYEGVIYKRKQDPAGFPGFFNALYAPDVCHGADGRYYLYYFLANHGRINVAVCDTPAGKYEYIGHVRYPDGTPLGNKNEPLQFDPGVFRDDDGQFYLYTGFGAENMPKLFTGGKKTTEHGAMGFRLGSDMLTVENGPVYIGVEGSKYGKGTSYEGHEFFEASSMRKRGDRYYFIYSTVRSHELAYAVSDDPLSGFTFGGVLISNGDIGLSDVLLNYTGNNHGSIENINGQEYIFYHRQTNRNMFSRQACAEKIKFKDGKFYQAEMTSCGPAPESFGKGEYGAFCACDLFSASGAYQYGFFKKPAGKHPYFTQKGRDRENDPGQYIANFADGACAVYKYFTFDDAERISVNVKARSDGVMKVFADEKFICSIDIKKGRDRFSQNINLSCSDASIRFKYEGVKPVEFFSFSIE